MQSKRNGLTPAVRSIALLMAVAASAAVAGDFEFAVIGDTRPRFESENFQHFEVLIRKINALKPAFVINVGDLIYGYGLPGKEKQWDKYQQVVKAIEVPYYQLPGNHDTHSKEARKIYVRRFGKCYGSFDCGDCHFVLLDNTEEEHWGYLGPAELEWLKNDLDKTTAQSVYVFMHFPVWEPERVAPDYYAFWAEKLHPLFKEHRVRAVFAGHYHSYGPTREFDGIRYFITGGGGAELRPEYRKAGGDYHFLWVKVSGDKLDLRVVTGRGELTDAEADVMGSLLFADRHASRIAIKAQSQELRNGVTCSISLSNPYPEVLSGRAEWILDASAFSVEPQRVSVGVQPCATQSWAFTLKALKDTVPLDSLPRLEFSVASGGRHHRFSRDVLSLREMNTPYRAMAPVLDGRWEEWGGVPALRLGEGSKAAVELRTAYNADALYLAVSIPAIDLATNEESSFSDDLQVGIASRVSDTDFGRDVTRLGFNRGATEAKDRTSGHKPGAVVAAVKAVSRTEGNRTSFEIAIPDRLLKLTKRERERRLVINLSFPLPDGGAEAKEPPEPSPNSFSYRVRYGADALVPVHFVELILEPKK